jgi:2-polyprenyl-3-methyl-5-hydroxy-6-metoxy-1,4-benzoquinol methylase
MKDEQNEFYTSISKYYSEIFPYQPAQLQFVKNRVGELAGKQVLDIGCAAGELAFQLAKEGAKVTGIDLNEDLLEQALSKTGCSGFPARGSGGRSADSVKRESKHDKYWVAPPNLHFQTGNMLELAKDFKPAQFDVVLCFGNTLVHLQTRELIQQMLKAVYSVLKSGGCFLLQILNYDYILIEQVSELPAIETENIQFIRKYKFEENSPLIRFQTELILKKEEITISNETLLFGLKSAELTELLKEAGFTEIELYSNFKQEPFGGKHLPLVVSCKK